MAFSRLKAIVSLQRIAVVLGIFFLLGGIVLRLLYQYWYTNEVSLTPPFAIDVKRGDSLNSVLNRLVDKEIIDHPLLARACLQLYRTDFTLKAGEYLFEEKAITRAQLFDKLGSGISRQYSITIVEGQTAEHFAHQLFGSAQLVDEHFAVSNADVLLLSAMSIQAKQMMAGESNPEGWFFPDTYYVARGDSYLAVLRRAHKKMLQILEREWQLRQPGLPYENAYQALIMASLIEKETGAIEERAQIAGVFVRRLKLRMRLQTDPSVIYGMGNAYRGNLRRADLKADTPYNTYTRHGLPPTPIALPGRGAIHAALNPAEGTTLYFVAKGDGRHHFSDTLEEHQRAVRRYQINNRRADYRSSPNRDT